MFAQQDSAHPVKSITKASRIIAVAITEPTGKEHRIQIQVTILKCMCASETEETERCMLPKSTRHARSNNQPHEQGGNLIVVTTYREASVDRVRLLTPLGGFLCGIRWLLFRR